MKIIDILQRLLNEQNRDPKNPESSPNLDTLGYDSDGYWTFPDWKDWFNSNETKYGKKEACLRFITQWEFAAEGFEDGEEEGIEWDNMKKWFKQKEMWNGPEDRPYTKKEFEDVLKYKEKYSDSSASNIGVVTGVSDKLVEYVKKEEFFVKCVYDDANGTPCIRKDFNACCLKGKKPKGIATIGYGTVYYPDGTRVSPSDKDISIETATKYLKVTLDTMAKKLLKIYPNLNQQQLDAMSSLCYNVGFAGCTSKAPNLSAAIKKDPNSKTNPKIKPNFLDFANADRRADEFGIYHDGNYPTA